MVEEIRQNGWRQGAIFPTDAHEKLQQYARCELAADDCCIVINQSCDLVCPDLRAEPIVEVVVAKRLDDEMHGSYTHAKNPRRIHFEININESRDPYEAHAGHRFSIPRETLAQIFPDPTRQLHPDGLPELVAWIVARYERQAFPDNFNERTSKVIDKKIKPILKKLPQLRAIYVALNTWEELAADHNYVIHLVGTISAENNKNPQLRAELETGLGRIATALNNCNGIEVEGAELRSEAIMTLDDTRQLARWHFDYISLADPENHER